MIIDAHIHAGNEEFCQGTEQSLPRYLCSTYYENLQLINTYGVNKAVLIPVAHRDIDTRPANEYVLRAHKEFPDRFIPFCRIDNMLEDNLASGFQGVKLHLVYEDIEISNISHELRVIEKAGVPLMLHAEFADKAGQVKDILNTAPGIKLILAHMGRGHIYTGEQVIKNALDLKPYSSVYFETSTSGGIESIIKAGDIIGFDRIIYGSDYPFGKKFIKSSLHLSCVL